MKEQILDKLTKFLNKRPSIKEECEVVYIMVELRKLLDRERERGSSISYPLVRFHADWAVHTRKDYRITGAMKKIMEIVDETLDPYPKNGNIDFLSMPEFRKELIKLTEDYNLPNVFCRNDSSWNDFLLTLIEVLVDQPIINPTKNIADFYYVGMKKEGVMATINFRGKKAGGSITLGFGL